MDGFTKLRLKMIDGQLRTQNVTDLDVLAAMAEVPRERFVPLDRKPFAYIDDDVLIKPAANGAAGRYLMEPAPFARLLQLAAPGKTDIVLDIGCATGYSAAVLSRLADSVVAVEEDADLARLASETLVELGIDNVAVVNAPLASGYATEGPYDVIFIDGAVEQVPKNLLGQLKENGRLVAIVGSGWSASGTIYTCSGGKVGTRAAFNAAVEPLPGFRPPAGFAF
jgi:protein-L-isoaspartate(D-aspartate) O-methyltransferase